MGLDVDAVHSLWYAVSMLKISRTLSLLWVALGFADLVSTYFALQAVGAYEANPIGSFLLGHGEVLFYGLKGLVVLGFGGLLWVVASRCTRGQLKLFSVFQFVVVAAYVAIVVNNALIAV